MTHKTEKGTKKLKEKWKWVPGFKGLYKVSNYGRVRSVTRNIKHRGKGVRPIGGIILKPLKDKNAKYKYHSVVLHRNGQQIRIGVHRLVLEAFIGPCPKGHQSCHFPDMNVENNRLDNLRWDTCKGNARDRMLHGKEAKGWRISASLTTTEKRKAICDLYFKLDYTIGQLSRIFKKPKNTIRYLIETF